MFDKYIFVMISVIVITYNQETTIGRTLDSVLQQKCCHPYEIVIGEDCSSDKTLEICKQYAQKYPDKIRLLANKQNKGLIDNYWDCILASSGEYIADVAGDDFWTDDRKLEKQIKILQENPNVSLVHTAWSFYEEKSGCVISKSNVKCEFENARQLQFAILTQTDEPIIHLCTSMYRKDMILEAYKADIQLFRDKKYCCEDLQIGFVLAGMGKVVYIDDNTLNYSIGHTSISNTKEEKKQFEFVLGTSRLRYYLARKYGFINSEFEQFMQKKIFALQMHAFRCRDKILAQTAHQCGSEWNVKFDLRNKLLAIIISHNILWDIAKSIRDFYVCKIKTRKK